MTGPVQLFLSRRNLLALLSKLDRTAAGDTSQCTIIKYDTQNVKYPQSHPAVVVTAVEDLDYYHDRDAGPMHPSDEQNLTKS